MNVLLWEWWVILFSFLQRSAAVCSGLQLLRTATAASRRGNQSSATSALRRLPCQKRWQLAQVLPSPNKARIGVFAFGLVRFTVGPR